MKAESFLLLKNSPLVLRSGRKLISLLCTLEAQEAWGQLEEELQEEHLLRNLNSPSLIMLVFMGEESSTEEVVSEVSRQKVLFRVTLCQLHSTAHKFNLRAWAIGLGL